MRTISFESIVWNQEQAYDKFHYADVNPFHKVVEQQINNNLRIVFRSGNIFEAQDVLIPFSGDWVPLPVSNPFLPVFVFPYFTTKKIWNLGEVGKEKITFHRHP